MTRILSTGTEVAEIMMKIYEVSKSEKIAEYTSSCPDSPIRFHIPTRNAREALAGLLIMVTLLPERAGEPKMFYTDHIARMCYNYNYEGQWTLVQEILEQRTMTPYSIFTTLTENMSREDIYGNLVPLILRLTKLVKLVKVSYDKTRRVKRTQRKRGYDDKGTLRLSHQWLPSEVHLGPNPIRTDRRHKSYTPRTALHWRNEYYRGGT